MASRQTLNGLVKQLNVLGYRKARFALMGKVISSSYLNISITYIERNSAGSKRAAKRGICGGERLSSQSVCQAMLTSSTIRSMLIATAVLKIVDTKDLKDKSSRGVSTKAKP